MVTVDGEVEDVKQVPVFANADARVIWEDGYRVGIKVSMIYIGLVSVGCLLIGLGSIVFYISHWG